MDNPTRFRDKRVIDFGAGCGASTVAARSCGAAHISVADIDPTALLAAHINISSNSSACLTTTDVTDLSACVEGIDFVQENIIGKSRGELNLDTIIVGDVLYEPSLARSVLNWLQALSKEGQ